MRKLDKIANSIIREFQGEDAFELGEGVYIALPNKQDKTLYSFMSDKRFAELLRRKIIKRFHYLDILDEFNGNLKPDRSQLSLLMI